MVSYKEQCHFTNEEFGLAVKDSFRELLDTSTLSDVTLVSEDDQHFEAHRVILASGSTFFRNILFKIKHPQPIIYLKGIKKNELNHIIEFVYTGEATIAREELETFLQSARDLEIKGLEKMSNVKIENIEPNLQIPDPGKELLFKKETLHQPDEKPIYESEVSLESKESSEPDKSLSNLRQKIMEGVTKVDRLWFCTYCNKTFNTRARATEHVETHLEGFSHTCNICNKSSKTTKALKMHIERVHSYKYSMYLKVIDNQ